VLTVATGSHPAYMARASVLVFAAGLGSRKLLQDYGAAGASAYQSAAGADDTAQGSTTTGALPFKQWEAALNTVKAGAQAVANQATAQANAQVFTPF
jgi:hypothetical protein